jgi:poly(3-hydroxyalkanoate) synthetase
MVNPPANPKAAFRTAPSNPADPGKFLATATETKGSWWPHYSSWLAERSGGPTGRPAELGARDYPPIGLAPGSYVHDH